MKIIAQMVVGPKEADRYLKLALTNLKSRKLCDDVVVCFNNADEDTQFMVRKFTPHVYYDNREWGKFQPYIKENLVKEHVAKFNPDWVISIDADEVFEDRVTRQILEELASKPNDVAYFFWCIEFWDDPSKYRADYSFEDTRFYKFIPNKLSYRKQQVHCGMIPEKLHQWATRSNYLFYHYGLMKKEDRVKRVERYKKYDPKNIYLPKSWYEGLLQEGVASTFNREAFLKRIHPTLFRKKPVPFSRPNVEVKDSRKRLFKFINPHGVHVTFSELEDNRAEAHYLARVREHDWTFLGIEYVNEGERGATTGYVFQPDVPVVESESVAASFDCGACGFIAKNKAGLRRHERIHKT